MGGRGGIALGAVSFQTRRFVLVVDTRKIAGVQR